VTLWRRKPWLVLDTEGISGRGLRRKIRWKEVEELSTRNVRGTQFLNLAPRSEVTLDARRPSMRLLGALNRALLDAPIYFAISRLDIPEHELLACTRRLASPHGVEVGF
jgi:hypothetical protein